MVAVRDGRQPESAAAVESSFDVAFWFIDRAMEQDEYLQPQKLHRLMYLAQAYFAVAYDGRMLMPAIMVADELGPIEPNVFRAFSQALPSIERKRLPEIASRFLDVVWRRFGHHSSEHLNKLIAGHAPFHEALARGKRSVIPLAAMIDFYGKKASPETAGVPSAASLVPPRMMRSQSGNAVEVKKWTPIGKKAP